MNISCVICSDLFVSADSIFSTPCGHIFHHTCLIQWMERSKSCPQCRNKCTERCLIRLFVNNVVNLDTTQNSPANLLESIDNLTLKLREKDQALKAEEKQRLMLEDTLKAKQKVKEKLDTSISRLTQVIATMRHELDILASNRANYKAVETENAELKAKLELMLSIESVLTASQREVDEILKQNLNARDLAVMVGTLRRELNSNEARKHELRKQLQMIKNDLRGEQEVRRKLQDKLSSFESENHSLTNRLRRLEKAELEEIAEVCEGGVETPEPAKRPRLALKHLGDVNTPSPLSNDEFQNRVAQVRESSSPYHKVKSSSIGLSSLLQKPMIMRDARQGGPFKRSTSSDALGKLSIFQKARIVNTGATPSVRPENVVYNGVGGTSKILQSDLRKPDDFWAPSKPATNVIKKKKNLSASVLGK